MYLSVPSVHFKHSHGPTEESRIYISIVISRPSYCPVCPYIRIFSCLAMIHRINFHACRICSTPHDGPNNFASARHVRLMCSTTLFIAAWTARRAHFSSHQAVIAGCPFVIIPSRASNSSLTLVRETIEMLRCGTRSVTRHPANASIYSRLPYIGQKSVRRGRDDGEGVHCLGPRNVCSPAT